MAAAGRLPAADAPSISAPGSSSRVVVVEDAGATEAFCPRAEVVRSMVDKAVTRLTGQTSTAAAWRSVLSTNAVVGTNEVIGIKVFSLPGRLSGTRPEVVTAVVEGLLEAGLSPKQILVWDAKTRDLRLAGFYELADHYGVRVASAASAGYDEKTFYESALIGNLVWGDLEFGRKGPAVGRRSFVSKLVTGEMTKIINITPLLSHNLAGVSGNLYSLASGSVDNFARFESDRARLATAVPEIWALPVLGDRVVLNITDALVGQYEGAERSLLHYSSALNELWFSRDAVALDVLGLQELERERLSSEAPGVKPNRELYANAALLELGVNDVKRIQVERVR